MADWPDFIDDLPITSEFVYIRRHNDAFGYAAQNARELMRLVKL